MKKILTILLALIIAAAFQVTAFAEEAADDTDFENWTYIVTEEGVHEPVTFKLMPSGYNNYNTEHRGQVLRMHYTTDAYGDGVTYTKYCTVYLPYGYDAEDTDTKYNVIYFQHGNSGSPNELWDHDMKKLHAVNLIDNMFDPDHPVMEPCIIICPTFYFETPEDEYVTPADNFAGDGRLETDYDLYYREVVEDLIPQIEGQFNVYCEDFSEEGIIASRDHRAWSGFSRGCLCTYYMFNHDLAYFKYWVPMSAPVRLRPEVGFEASLDDCYNFMKEAIDANPDMDFFIYGTAGGEKDTSNPPDLNQVVYLGDMMTEEFNFYAQQPEFSFGNDPAANNLYIVRSEFIHLGLNVPYNWANAADVLFK